jgi:hypothetical protein
MLLHNSRRFRMSTKDTLLMVFSLAAGAAAGFTLGGIVGGIVGGFTGLGVLVVVYFIADNLDTMLREHYRKI